MAMGKQKKRSSNKALTARSKIKFGNLIGVVSTLVVGYVFFSFAFIIGRPIFQAILPPALEVLRSQDWPEVPCTIVKSELSANPPFQLEICYSFEFNQQHENCQYSINEAQATGPKEDLEVIARQYPVGQKTVCYVDPEDPGNAILVKTPQWKAWRDIVVIAVPALILLIALISVLRTLNRRLNRRNVAEQENPFTPKTSQDQQAQSVLKLKQSKWVPEKEPLDDGLPTELQSETQLRGCGAVFLGVFTAIWIGVVSVVASKRLPDWKQGDFGGADLIVLFLAAVGFLLLVGLIYFSLSLFNPVAKVTLSRKSIPLGESGTISWEFDRPPHSIAEFTITLKAVEQVRYTVGTNTSVEEKAFHEDLIFETNEPTAIANGQAVVTIPGHLMHSFESVNNKIIWRIQLHGKIASWPDAYQVFKLQVPPHRSI
ncbi:DUF3592 domain-containing protein [Planctomicrobium sp. SH527]|uniref:DUF3592 domain-containing protein n=1 Tax=Planctomicrobium sp. SH527 TaxID=3448123 RepID=UPI003F5BAB1E